MKCQLCETGVPLFPSEFYNGHMVSWDPGIAGLIPCNQEEREKIQALEKRLQESSERHS